ncbi:LGFP repeat-containing protein [Corynebacterium freneyi]|uniref:LGFP repeat-containing protein n=1 Tax=Corynebacterium freneyi TaxID=134034 RepID=UPI001EF23E1C|nr:YtxH domain-containing protein [Corynebacterium freneyi]MCG7440196.1 YtxH domain-containing protein [Corynebacterium freneyi]
MRKTSITRTSAAIFGATLLLGAAACSTDEAKDNANKATDAVESAVNDATAGQDSGESTAAEGEGSEGMDDEGAADDAAGEDVAEADLPGEVTEAAEAANLGAFKSAEKVGDNVLAEFDNGWVVSSPDGGTHPIVGKIGETWNADGALDNEVGLPTDGEKEIEGGWEQPFTNGTIQWTQDEDGQFSAKYM